MFLNKQIIIEKYSQAEFKDFKEMIRKMQRGYGHLKQILASAKDLLSNTIHIKSNELYVNMRFGQVFSIYKCDVCHKMIKIDNRETFLVFRCEHIMHTNCSELIDGLLFCHICTKEEMAVKETDETFDSIVNLVCL